MAKDTTSPFRPGQPVPVEFFVGRLPEVERLAKKAAAAVTGRLEVAFLVGERGIGKSSLASFVKSLVERDHAVFGLHTFLGGVNSLEEMARRVFDRLVKESAERPWKEKIRDLLSSSIREVGLFGLSMEFAPPQTELQRLVRDWAPALRKVIERLRDDRKGLVVILDDINGLAESAEFANWLKSLVDEIATSGKPLPLFLLLVGLEERRQSLLVHQPSLARVFDVVEIRPWSAEETRRFFQETFANGGISVDQEALSTLVEFTGGLPVLAHEIGDAAFNADSDGRLDPEDAVDGVIGAADIVGRKYLQAQVYQAIRSEKYRGILRTICEAGVQMTFRRGDLLPRLKQEEQKVLDNFLKRMKALGVIRPEEEKGPGAYRFDNQLHRVYLWLEARRARAKPA